MQNMNQYKIGNS